MKSNKQPSLQDIVKRRRHKEFVGRIAQLELFQDNLARSWDDEQRIFLFDVSGQGGVGKSTLLARYRQMAENAGAVTVQTDETETDVLTVMERFSFQLEQQGHSLDKFDERYKVYRQRREELEENPDAPQGFTAFAASTLTKTGINFARQLPVGSMVLNLIDTDALANQVGDWAEYVRRKLTNKDEVHLVLQPEEVLTPIFLRELHQIASESLICFFFDTYERTDVFLGVWIRDMLEGHYGGFPANSIIVIAGREELNRNLWHSYDELIARISLEPFSENEVREYLALKGIDNEHIIEAILDLSDRLPLLVAMLSTEIPNDLTALDDASSTAVARFLKWVPDPARRQIVLNAALPRFLNRDILELLPEADDVDDLFDWLKEMPFVKEKGRGWLYHDVVRSQMLRYKRRESPQKWREIHERLASYYATLRNNLKLETKVMYMDPIWQGYELEFRYHQLCQAPHEYLHPAINKFLNALKAKLEFGRRWAMIIQQAGADIDNSDVKAWGNRLQNGLRAYDEKKHRSVIEMFSGILQLSSIESYPRAIALAWRGESYREIGQLEKALEDFDCAVELKPDDPWIFHRRGWVHMRTDQYEKALADFDKAVQHDSTYINAYVDKGQALRNLQRSEDALASLDIAIELDPESDHAFHGRGYIYLLMGEPSRALIDLDRAVELNSEDAINLVHRGETLYRLEQYEKALIDFERALELTPDESYDISYRLRKALYYRWKIYAILGRRHEALADINQLIELDPNNPWYFHHQGWVHMRMNRYEAALDDFDMAIQLDPNHVNSYVDRGQALRGLNRDEESLSSANKAIELEPNNDHALFFRGSIYLRFRQLNEALVDLNNAIELNEDAIYMVHRGETYYRLEQYEKALGDFEQALRLTPSDPYDLSYRLWRALCYHWRANKSLGRHNKAISTINKIIELSPDEPWRFYERGLAYQILGQTIEANSDFESAIQMDINVPERGTKDWDNYFNLALYHLAKNNISESHTMYRRVESSNIPYFYIDRAIEDLQDYLRFFPDYQQAKFEITYLQKYLGKAPADRPDRV